MLEENEWRLLWKLKIQDWLKLFLWRCGNNAFPFKGRMSEVMHTGEEGRDLCPLCKGAKEEGVHLFVQCPVAQTLWRESAWPMVWQGVHYQSRADIIRIVI